MTLRGSCERFRRSQYPRSPETRDRGHPPIACGLSGSFIDRKEERAWWEPCTLGPASGWPNPEHSPWNLISVTVLTISASARERIWRSPVRKTMAKAVWNGKVIAESETTEIVEGNVYFPENSLKREYFRPS